ncbi:MAG: CpaF family protein, partial [Sulfobacillus sp.]|nr:CpaF family protein [Sulfobacillus sp.]
MSPYRWSPTPSPLSHRAQEARSDWDHVFRQWTTLLQQQFPEHLAYLVWDAPRIHALELVADEIMPQYPDWDPALAPVLRRAWINRLTGLGPLEELLLDETVSDIM